MDGIPQSGSYTLSQHVFQIFPTVILRCVTPQKAGDSMNIGIVGAGKVGFSFGRLLAEKGVRISGYYSRNSDSAREAAEFTNSGHYTDLGKLIEDSDAIFITVPDNAITEVYRQVAEFEIQDKYMSLQRRLHSRESLSRYSRAGSLCNIHSSAISDQQQV